MVKFNRQALIEARLNSFVSDGGEQYDIAENGLQGIDSMSDAQLKDCCDYFDIDYTEEDDG